MAGIFINYRTGDGEFAAPLVNLRLVEEFGHDYVFLDSQALSPGTDFPPEIWRRLRASTVLLVLIGRYWSTITGGDGRRRIDNPDDWVRQEIRDALGRTVTVIPVLLDDTSMPRAVDLPADIRPLAERQHCQLRSRSWDADLRSLVDTLAGQIPRGRRPGPTAGGGSTAPSAPGGGFVFHDTNIFGGNQTYAETAYTTHNNHYGPPPQDHWQAGLTLLRERSFEEAAGHLRQRLAEPGAGAEVHYYLALAMLGSRPPRDHASVREITEHLNRAAALAVARLLWLVVEEDHRPGRRREADLPAQTLALVQQVDPMVAGEIVGQFRAANSPTWQALARRAAQR